MRLRAFLVPRAVAHRDAGAPTPPALPGQADKQAIIKANEASITNFMGKPLQPDELKKRLLAIRKAQRQQTLGQQIRKVGRGRKQSMHDIFSPHIVFGEPLSKIADLKKPDNRHLVPYLNDSCEVINELNENDKGLQLGYVMKTIPPISSCHWCATRPRSGFG